MTTNRLPCDFPVGIHPDRVKGLVKELADIFPGNKGLHLRGVSGVPGASSYCRSCVSLSFPDLLIICLIYLLLARY